MPSARVRFAGESGFLILVALGAGLARFDPLVIGAIMLMAWVLVALYERACAKEAAREAQGEVVEEVEERYPEPPPHVERIELEPTRPPEAEPEPEAAPESEPEPEPEPAVSERSARAILASAPPPLPPEPPKPKPKPKPKPARRRRVERRPPPPKAAPPPPPPPPEPEPEPVPVHAGPPREWNLWEIQRSVRDLPDDPRHEEWSAILIHLREFANADGDLPIEFDGLVRESFAGLLEPKPEPAAAS